MPMVNASAVPSTSTVCSSGRLKPWRCVTARVAKTANSRPSAAPQSESTRLSVSSWRIRRARVAPSAVRTAISG